MAALAKCSPPTGAGGATCCRATCCCSEGGCTCAGDGAGAGGGAAAMRARVQNELAFAVARSRGDALLDLVENLSLPAGTAFAAAAAALLTRSVQRPPFPVAAGVFAPHDARRILSWLSRSYFRYYAVYAYAFTSRVTLDVSTHRAGSLVEAPACAPPGLGAALSDDEHLARQQLEADKRVAAQAAADEAAAAAAECERVRELAAAYDALLPEGVQERVAAAVERELAGLRACCQGSGDTSARKHSASVTAAPSSPPLAL